MSFASCNSQNSFWSYIQCLLFRDWHQQILQALVSLGKMSAQSPSRIANMYSHVPTNHNVNRVVSPGGKQPDDLEDVKDVKEDSPILEPIQVHVIGTNDQSGCCREFFRGVS